MGVIGFLDESLSSSNPTTSFTTFHVTKIKANSLSNLLDFDIVTLETSWSVFRGTKLLLDTVKHVIEDAVIEFHSISTSTSLGEVV